MKSWIKILISQLPFQSPTLFLAWWLSFECSRSKGKATRQSPIQRENQTKSCFFSKSDLQFKRLIVRHTLSQIALMGFLPDYRSIYWWVVLFLNFCLAFLSCLRESSSLSKAYFPHRTRMRMMEMREVLDCQSSDKIRTFASVCVITKNIYNLCFSRFHLLIHDRKPGLDCLLTPGLGYCLMWIVSPGALSSIDSIIWSSIESIILEGFDSLYLHIHFHSFIERT